LVAPLWTWAWKRRCRWAGSLAWRCVGGGGLNRAEYIYWGPCSRVSVPIYISYEVASAVSDLTQLRQSRDPKIIFLASCPPARPHIRKSRDSGHFLCSMYVCRSPGLVGACRIKSRGQLVDLQRRRFPPGPLVT